VQPEGDFWKEVQYPHSDEMNDHKRDNTAKDLTPIVIQGGAAV